MGRAVNIDRALGIEGWMHPEELSWLATQAQTHMVIVEIGSFKGRSTRALADHAPGVVYAVDPWGPYKTKGRVLVYEAFAANLADHIATAKVVPIRVRSQQLAEQWAGHPKADMVFIDGHHDEASVLRDIAVARSILTEDGLLCGHDYRHPGLPGVHRAVDQTFAHVQCCQSIWWVP